MGGIHEPVHARVVRRVSEAYVQLQVTRAVHEPLLSPAFILVNKVGTTDTLDIVAKVGSCLRSIYESN